MNQKELRIFAANIRKAALRAVSKIGAGHIGGSMSMADLMAVLYGDVMKIDPKNPKWEERDWLVVSKGHCGPAVYPIALQLFEEADIPTHLLPGMEFCPIISQDLKLMDEIYSCK